jgi:hypothetical protein
MDEYCYFSARGEKPIELLLKEDGEKVVLDCL